MSEFNPSLLTKDSELQDILMEGYIHTDIFAKTFFPEIFELPFGDLHRQIFEAIDSPDPKVVVAAPRGIGKTSIAGVYAAKKIVYRDSHFITYISNSATSAEMQTENIKSNIRSNKALKDLFGDIKSSPYSDGNDYFSKKTWIANGYSIVLPRGSGQQIRGLNWIRFRPDIFVIDDLEDTDTLDNETIRQDRKIWFFGDVLKAKPIGGKPYKFIYIDTVKHEDSLIEELLDSDGWTSLRLSICDDNYQTLVPEFKSQEELDAELADHRKRHIMDVFARENQSIPISKEAASFKSEYFRYYREDSAPFIKRRPYIENVVIADPSKTSNPSNAQSGIIAWGVDVESNALYLREARGEYYHPEQLYADIFETALKYNARVIGLEVTGLNEFITYPFRNEMMRRGLNFEILELKARKGEGEFSGVGGGKKGRISSLIPLYRQGLVYHNEVGCGAYERQILGFPKSKLWDIMDGAAYIVEILEKGLRYFAPRGEEEDDESAVNREFKELEKMDEFEYGPLDYEELCPGIPSMTEASY